MKLRELKRWTKVKLKDGTIAEFLWVDWMYCRWKCNNEIEIMWHANQDVSEYWEVLDDNIERDG